MKYEDAPDLKERMNEVITMLNMGHIDINRIECIRSFGSSTRRTIARCHTLGKLMQKAMKTKAFYAIEFLEKFDRLDKNEQDKVIIHGGFRKHDFVCEKNIEVMYEKFVNLKEKKEAKQANLADFEDRIEKKKSYFFWK